MTNIVSLTKLYEECMRTFGGIFATSKCVEYTFKVHSEIFKSEEYGEVRISFSNSSHLKVFF
jgi:hypothetical protein